MNKLVVSAKTGKLKVSLDGRPLQNVKSFRVEGGETGTAIATIVLGVDASVEAEVVVTPPIVVPVEKVALKAESVVAPTRPTTRNRSRHEDASD